MHANYTEEKHYSQLLIAWSLHDAPIMMNMYSQPRRMHRNKNEILTPKLVLLHLSDVDLLLKANIDDINFQYHRNHVNSCEPKLFVMLLVDVLV